MRIAQVVTRALPESEVRLEDASALGNVGTRRIVYKSLTRQIGTDLSPVLDSNCGTVIYVNTDGNYSIRFSDTYAGSLVGVTVNGVKTVNISSQQSNTIIMFVPNANPSTQTAMVRLKAGDKICGQADSGYSGTNGASEFIQVTRVL